MSFPICKYFKSEQGCKFGNKCRFKHSDFSPPGNQYFDHQNERQGSVTGFYPPESSASQRYLQPRSNENEVSVRNQVFGDFDTISSDPYLKHNGPSVSATHSSGASSDQIQEQFQHLTTNDEPVTGVESNQRPTRKVCHFFARNGSCCFGSRCRFEHARPNSQPPRFQQNQHDPERYAHETQRQGQASGSQDDESAQRSGLSYPGNNNHERNFSSTSSPADYPDQFGSAPYPTEREGVAGRQGSDRGQNVTGTDEDGAGSGRNQQPKSNRVCQFFVTGKCWRGYRCKFLHPGAHTEEPPKRRVVTGASRQDNSRRDDRYADKSHRDNNYSDKSYGDKSQSDNSYGDKKSHREQVEDGNRRFKQADKQEDRPSKPRVQNDTVDSKKTSPEKDTRPARQPRAPYVAQGTKKYRRDEVDEVEASRLRRMEIDQLIKRFPKSKVKVNRDNAEYFQCVVSFSPTDPDWPFDVKVFQLQIDIPADYPFEMMIISLPEEQDLPETVRRYVEVSSEEWLGSKEAALEGNGQVELVFRPFLRWLDRSLEDTVTEGLKQLKREMVAKASGLEFISAKQLQKQYPGQTSGSHDNDDDDEDDDDETTSGSQDEEDSSSDYDDDSDNDQQSDDDIDDNDEKDEGKKEKADSKRKSRQDNLKAMMVDPERKGTEICLRNLQLKESTGTLYLDKICLAVQCERCKGTSEFTTSGGKVNVVQCGQCSQTQLATFRPALVHQFSAAIGFLDLQACLPFDVVLQRCSVVISCLHCSKETKPGALLPGPPQDHMCRVCHHKLRVATDGVRFTQLEPSKAIQSISGAVKVVVPTRKRLPKDPAIQEGKPLPNFGTCRHYKKSYRWLRFPCCGKAYPCDVCHDTKEDHEMKFANRMICGFCCKEQGFAAERPCKGCDMNLTKVHTVHWEGGGGCRNKITMSRNDKQKHSNMNKTVSKHAQKVKDMQSKKRTKLRHT